MSEFDLNQYAGAGMEDIPQSGSMPVLKIVQKGSPEFDESHKQYKDKKVDGCRPGDIVFQGEVLKRPIRVVPLASTQIYAEFKPQNLGGGFVRNQPLSIIENRAYRKGAPGSDKEHKEYLGENELQFNIIYIIKFLKDGEWVDGLLMFSSTELKAARAWGRLIKGSKHPMVAGVPPIFANTYIFTTVPQNNAKGSWFGWEITRPTDSAVTVDADLRLFAESFESAKLALPKPQQEAAKALPAPVKEEAPTEDKVPF